MVERREIPWGQEKQTELFAYLSGSDGERVATDLWNIYFNWHFVDPKKIPVRPSSDELRELVKESQEWEKDNLEKIREPRYFLYVVDEDKLIVGKHLWDLRTHILKREVPRSIIERMLRREKDILPGWTCVLSDLDMRIADIGWAFTLHADPKKKKEVRRKLEARQMVIVRTLISKKEVDFLDDDGNVISKIRTKETG